MDKNRMIGGGLTLAAALVGGFATRRLYGAAVPAVVGIFLTALSCQKKPTIQKPTEKSRTYNVAVLGDAKSGKNALTYRLKWNDFSSPCLVSRDECSFAHKNHTIALWRRPKNQRQVNNGYHQKIRSSALVLVCLDRTKELDYKQVNAWAAEANSKRILWVLTKSDQEKSIQFSMSDLTIVETKESAIEWSAKEEDSREKLLNRIIKELSTQNL